MTLYEEVRDKVEQYNEGIIDVIFSYIEKENLEQEMPVITFENDGEMYSFSINGELKLRGKNIDAIDVLRILEESGIIELE